LLALSFPKYGHPIAALVALVPLLVALSGWRGRAGVLPGVPPLRGFALGALTGVVHYAGSVYWTADVVHTYGGLVWPAAVLAAAGLVLYMAIYTAASATAIAVLVQRLGAGGLWLAPLAWVAAEYARGHVLGGFPWIPLGGAVVTLLPVAQLASLVGVYGLSCFLAFLAAAMAVAVTGQPREARVAIAVALTLLVSVSVWGALRIRDGALAREGEPFTVGLVQGNIPQADKWNPGLAPDILDRYLSMTREAAARGARLVIWPESSTPFFFDEDPARAAAVRSVVRESSVPLLFGTDEYEPGPPARFYNSAFMLHPDGATAAVYRKIHLVPFGEYVPLRTLLFFVAPLVESVSDFAPGTRVTMLPVDGHMASTAICYEVVYPHLIRRGVLEGAELLTTVTNDAWYGRSSAPYQHYELAAMRAIEQGRYLARAANTGISAIVDPYGREVARSSLFETTVVTGEVRFIQARTVYATIGDVVPQMAVLVTLLGLAAAFWRRPDRGVGA
jgi:apolipoprotein N-acyltransferase